MPLDPPPILTLSKRLTESPPVPHHARFRLRVGSYDDAGDWLELQNRAFAEVRSGRLWQLRDFRREVAPTATGGTSQLLFADSVQGDTPVGTLLVAERPDPTEGGALQLRWLAVDPRWQRQGIARLLVQAAERIAWAASYRQLQLETLAGWTAAVAFYRSVGFVAEESR